MKMPKKWNASTRVRLIGFWASVIAVAALSTTVLSGNPSAGFGRSITRDEQVFLLLIAALLCALQLIAYLIQRRRTPQSATIRCFRRAEREKPIFEKFMSSEIMHQILETIEEEANSQPSPSEFERAYQARVAIDRIRFAIKHTEQFCPKSNPLREAGWRLLDALQRLETVDRRFQERSPIRGVAKYKGLHGSAAVNGNGDEHADVRTNGS